MTRLQDKVALVTGGASGIGEATVRRFASEGALVVFTDVADGTELAAETGSTFLRQDVADPVTWTEVVRSIEERHGRLDVLVNNAGIVGNQSIVDLDLETMNRVMAINVTGVALGTQAAIASMRKSGGGSIINVASTTSFLGLAFDVAYTASKHAVVGITRSSAAYCAQERLGIRVNTLHPGAIYTAILQGHVEKRPELFDVFSNMAPVGRMGDASEVASMAVYLASDDSSFSTGAQFVVDGGIVNTHPSM
ncbi:MAG: 3-oxoacyl-ACP reductase [Gordonia sp.]|uniref:SDR family oxidoreductase n=1 Tax=Gordonia rubripertincta TaxID=36822 RepID=A0ABT4MS06_GORRU|nr:MULTISPECIES: SDR family oxidoreductase [Mycobacteriales]MBA4021465.1 3-oxoacyl-ACP reductase [Gordonia sp. (in: high G+C Gram-positive bacteria)]MCZ4549430.1 SDR family oxidoreductase [Gordonia rubripertincta]OZG30654.1 short-chain dehydrogenase [Williamsia sp. 1138]